MLIGSATVSHKKKDQKQTNPEETITDAGYADNLVLLANILVQVKISTV